MVQQVKAMMKLKLSVRLTLGTLRQAWLLQVHGGWQRSAHEAQYGVRKVKFVFLTQSPIHYGTESERKRSSSLIVVRLVKVSCYLNIWTYTILIDNA